jgi:DNA-binding NtrC family response regulator
MKSLPPPEETEVQGAFALEPAAPPKRGAATLRWRDMSGDHVTAVESTMLLGSSPGSAIVIDDRLVSRLHAELDPREDGLWLRDLGSRNGTYVEGMRVGSVRLRDGAHVSVGMTTIEVAYGEQVDVDLWPEARFGRLVGRSAPMRALFAQLARVAPLEASVLVLGETGTGKELVARALHDASSRASGPFVVVDCAAIPETLLDAELFGHTRGAFTGADAARIGAIEAADGGTVFLDEIGELPMSMQPKLLRVLESRTVRRVGESVHRAVNVRFISATHRDLVTMVNAGAFREDLYFRLAVVPLNVPPLRTRPEDIELLVSHFLPRGAGKLSPDVLHVLARRPWRGNVRELRNFVERAVALGPSQALALISDATNQASDAPPAPGGGSVPRIPLESPLPAVPELRPSVAPPGTGRVDFDFDQSFKDFRDKWMDYGEREYLLRLLERHGRNVAMAASEAGVDRTYIYRLMRKHAL